MFGKSPVPFGQRYRTSREIFGQAWQLIRSERDLWRFPITTGVLFLLMIGGISALMPLVFRTGFFESVPPQLTGLIIIPIALVVSFPIGFVGALFNSAYAFGLHERLEGRDVSAAQAWARARSHAGTILRFSLIAALIGGVLAIVGQLLNKLRLVPFLGTLVQQLGAYAWAVAAFFVIPIIVVERERSAGDAVRKSISMARDTWGRSTAGIVTIGLALMVPMMVFLGLAMLVIFGSMSFGIASGGAGFAVALPIMIGTTIVMLIGLCAMMVVNQAAMVAYQVALYSTTRTGNVPLPFTPETVVDAWDPYRNK